MAISSGSGAALHGRQLSGGAAGRLRKATPGLEVAWRALAAASLS
jgi:hypothetical protein